MSAFSSAVFFAALSLESRQIGLLVVLSSGSVSCLPQDSNVRFSSELLLKVLWLCTIITLNDGFIAKGRHAAGTCFVFVY